MAGIGSTASAAGCADGVWIDGVWIDWLDLD
jgi:hypothetical protein